VGMVFEVELARDEVRRDRLLMRGICGHAKALWRGRQDASLAHEARDAVLACRKAKGLQFYPNARAAVAALHVVLDVLNLLREELIGLHALAERSRTPRVVAGPRHLQHPAHRGDVPDAGVRLDKGESHRRSLAKKAVAFFRISRSSRSRSFSLARRRTCSSSESTRPALVGFSGGTVRSQLRSVVVLTPSSTLSSLTERFGSLASRTASRRNSSLNFCGPRLRI